MEFRLFGLGGSLLLSQQIQTANTGVQMTQGSITIMPSSWIRDVDYNTLTNELKINMRGKWYGPWYVSLRTYNKFITGQAVPVTTDKQRPARWARGAGPSLGAAWHKYIKIGGRGAGVVRRIREFTAKIRPFAKGVKKQGLLGVRVAQKYNILGQIQ